MSDYEPTDSESDYEENEKILLENVRRGNRGKYDSTDESEEEVFNVRPDDSDDDNEIELADSDVEGQADVDDLPNENAWGKDKRKFYSTDFVDPDYEELDEKTARLAELEEEEATRLQLKLARQLTDDDFGLDFLKEGSNEKVEELVEEKIKTDTSKLTKREKLQFLKQESPELFGLIKDFKVKREIQENFLEPVLNKYRLGQLPNSSGVEFVQTFNCIISNYIINITAYCLLKSDNTKLDHHPIIKRLLQYRQLLEELCNTFDKVMKEKIQSVLAEENLDVSKKLKERKKHKNLEDVSNEPIAKKKKTEKKIKVNKEKEGPVIETKMTKENEIIEKSKEQMKNPSKSLEETDVLEKRAITYQIEKNKGLTPHRKKEQRNPRVKHRNKFRKAKIRRKGAVREVRNELKRYGGEISGIKSTVTKSIKIKS